MNILMFIENSPEPKTMNNSSLVAFCIAAAASGAVHAYEEASNVAVQRVVASIKADVASQFDCVSDDDTHRFEVPPAPAAAPRLSAKDLAAADKENRQRVARVARELRSTSQAR